MPVITRRARQQDNRVRMQGPFLCISSLWSLRGTVPGGIARVIVTLATFCCNFIMSMHCHQSHNAVSGVPAMSSLEELCDAAQWVLCCLRPGVCAPGVGCSAMVSAGAGTDSGCIHRHREADEDS